MSLGTNILFIILGAAEVAVAFMAEKNIRSRYTNANIKDLEGLIKWQKNTTIATGVCIAALGMLSILGLERYADSLMIIIIAVIILSRVGRIKFIK